ncbi:MAG: cupin domain-containing protein [Neisseria sp.]|nr:cupin domain-containing protein [Neisseria sp.]
MQKHNILQTLPEPKNREHFEAILHAPDVRIERIVSYGQTSPDTGWYDQDEHEWVLLLQGCAVLVFADGREISLEAGDYVHIPAHCRHRVGMTDKNGATVWLAVFYR